MKNADTSVAMGSDKARHVRETGAEVLVTGDSSCLMHIGGLLSRQRAGVRPMHLAEVLASTESASDDRHLRRDAAVPRGGPGRRSADTQLRHNLAHATTTIRDKRARVVAEVEDWEELRVAGRRDQGHRARRPRDPPAPARGAADRRRCHGALGPRRRGGVRDRRLRREVARRRRGGQGQVDGHRRDRAQRGAGRRGDRGLGDRPGRADRAARRRPAEPHPGAGDPPQPRRDPRDLPRSRWRPPASRHRPT